LSTQQKALFSQEPEPSEREWREGSEKRDPDLESGYWNKNSRKSGVSVYGIALTLASWHFRFGGQLTRV